MTTVAYAILVLSGAILLSAGTVTDVLKQYSGGTCQVLGAILGIIGFVGCVVKPIWDAIPVPEKKGEAKRE